jgi:hypothetical protein
LRTSSRCCCQGTQPRKAERGGVVLRRRGAGQAKRLLSGAVATARPCSAPPSLRARESGHERRPRTLISEAIRQSWQMKCLRANRPHSSMVLKKKQKTKRDFIPVGMGRMLTRGSAKPTHGYAAKYEHAMALRQELARGIKTGLRILPQLFGFLRV